MEKIIIITIIALLFVEIGHILHNSFCFGVGAFTFAFAYFEFLERIGLWKK